VGRLVRFYPSAIMAGLQKGNVMEWFRVNEKVPSNEQKVIAVWWNDLDRPSICKLPKGYKWEETDTFRSPLATHWLPIPDIENKKLMNVIDCYQLKLKTLHDFLREISPLIGDVIDPESGKPLDELCEYHIAITFNPGDGHEHS
jgi:hypothetical protein